jgi:hypothetical protein
MTAAIAMAVVSGLVVWCDSRSVAVVSELVVWCDSRSVAVIDEEHHTT